MIFNKKTAVHLQLGMGLYSQMLPAKAAYFSLDCKLGEDIFKPIHQHFSAEFLYTVSAVYFSLDTSLC